MTSLSKDEILAMATKAGFLFSDKGYGPDVLHTDRLEYSSRCYERFATLCRAPLVAEVERLEQWHAEMADNRNAIASERDTLKAELAQEVVNALNEFQDAAIAKEQS